MLFLRRNRGAIGSLLLISLSSSSSLAFSSPSGAVSSASVNANSVKTKYSELTQLCKEIETLNGIKGLLGYDEMVSMPPGAANSRNDQKSILSGVIYEKSTSDRLKNLIESLNKEDLSVLDSDYDRANVRDATRDYRLTVSKTKEMTMKESELESKGTFHCFSLYFLHPKHWSTHSNLHTHTIHTHHITRQTKQLNQTQINFSSRSHMSYIILLIIIFIFFYLLFHPQYLGYQAWVEARKNNDLKLFSPTLAEVIALKKEVAAATQPHLSAYDANIDLFERGMTSQRLDEIFSACASELIPLIDKIAKSEVKKTYEAPGELDGTKFSIEQQKLMCERVVKDMGFDFDKGVMQVSVHPFTGGAHPTDVRITTRYSEDNWLEGVAGAVHEGGHALYEQGRNPSQDNLPVSRALSMGIHESQSLFWERMVFQSMEFCEYFIPILHEHFPHTSKITAKELYEFINRVEPGFIRVDADEVTYPLHIVLRFEMEKAMFEGKVNPENHELLSSTWNKKMKDSLGLVVEKDSQGCLQDIHWSIGAIGYFPSYTLGAIAAAQLFEELEKQMPDARDKIRRGDFNPIREWLRVNVHEKGSLYDSPDLLLTKITGRSLDPNAYTRYLKSKYSALYKLT